MVTETLVEDLIQSGQLLVDELPKRGFEVSAALWLKRSEDGKWYFYIVSPIVETDGIVEAYKRLHPLVRGMPEPMSIDPLKIKLIGTSSPIGKDVVGIYRRLATKSHSPITWGGTQLGNASIEQALLYPLAATP